MKITRTAIAALAATGAVGLAAVPVLAQDTSNPTDSATDEATTDDAAIDQATTDDEPSSGDAADDGADEDGRHGHVGAFGADLAEKLAAELDVDVDDATAALDAIQDRWVEEHAAEREARRAEFGAARDEALAAAVEDGSLTQDQADLLTDLWAARDEAADGLRRDDLTDEQQAALEAFRESAGADLPGRGGFGGRGRHHGRGSGPGDADDSTGTPDPSDDATVQEGALLTT